MSYAAGRAWSAAGEGLTNIGRLLMASQEQRRQDEERKRERERQDEADRLAAQAEARTMARFTQETGLAPDGTIPATTSLYSGGTRQAPSAKALSVTPVAQQSATPALAGISKVTAGIPAPRTGGFVQVGRSAAQRAEDQALKEAATAADVLATGNPAFAALPWRQQVQTAGTPSLTNAFNTQQTRAATAATKEAETAATTTDAAYYLGRHRELAGLSPAEQVVRGRELDARHPAAGNTRSGGDAGSVTPQVYQQIVAEARGRLSRWDAQLRAPTGYRLRRKIESGEIQSKDETTEFNAIVRERFQRGELTTTQRDRLLGGGGAVPPVAPTTAAPPAAPAVSPATPVAPAGGVQPSGAKIPVSQVDWDNLARQNPGVDLSQYYVVR